MLKQAISGLVLGVLLGISARVLGNTTSVHATETYTDFWPTQWWTDWAYVWNGTIAYNGETDNELIDEYNQHTVFKLTPRPSNRMPTCRDIGDNSRWADFRRTIAISDFMELSDDDPIGFTEVGRVTDNLLGPYCPTQYIVCIIPDKPRDPLRVYGACNRSSLKAVEGAVSLNASQSTYFGADTGKHLVIHEVGHAIGLGHVEPSWFPAGCFLGNDESIMYTARCREQYLFNSNHSLLIHLTTADVSFIDSIH